MQRGAAADAYGDALLGKKWEEAFDNRVVAMTFAEKFLAEWHSHAV